MCVTEETSKCNVRVVPLVEGMHYIAVSHVWADGLGNANQNKIQLCQMRRLHDALKTVEMYRTRAKKMDRPAGTYLFWIDTLCCPVRDQQARIRTISDMRKIYERADLVVVMDADLSELPRPSNVKDPKQMLEVYGHVLTSGWMRRLWTYQEAAFARELVVIMKGWITDFKTLREMALRIAFPRNAYSFPALDLFMKGTAVSRFGGFISPDSFIDGIRDRLVAKPQDEPLCLSALLGLDIKSVASKRNDARYEEFLKLFLLQCPLPGEIVFYEGERLESTGLRWAPKSLRRPETLSLQTSCKVSGCRATKIPGGLQVRLPGILFLTAPEPAFQNCASSSEFLVRPRQGPWMRLEISGISSEDVVTASRYSIGLALVLEHRGLSIANLCRMCLLGQIIVQNKDTTRIRPVGKGTLTTVLNKHEAALEYWHKKATWYHAVGHDPDRSLSKHTRIPFERARAGIESYYQHALILHSHNTYSEQDRVWDIEY